jgi:hypothetical protein
LVANYVMCPKLTLTHGSLLVPYIECDELAAEILGVFRLSHAFEAPKSWAYVWLRPAWLPLPSALDFSAEYSIEATVKALMHPAITKNTKPIERLMARVRSRPSCGRARVLFQVALEELSAQEDAVTPLGRQVIDCLLKQPSLPENWRY